MMQVPTVLCSFLQPPTRKRFVTKSFEKPISLLLPARAVARAIPWHTPLAIKMEASASYLKSGLDSSAIEIFAMSVKMWKMYRKVLNSAVSITLLENGFESVEQTALDILVEMTQSLIFEIGKSSRIYCELSGRTEPLFADVMLSLINMGIRIDGIEQFAMRPNRTSIPAPIQPLPPKQINILQTGVKQDHPPHIPAHLPPFPDTHTYIRTPTRRKLMTDYEAIRDKCAIQKQDMYRALTKYLSRTRETNSYFLTQENQFPVIACKRLQRPYLNALISRDQIFNYNEYDVVHERPQRKNMKDFDGKEEEKTPKTNSNKIDNPYLRSVKLPSLFQIGSLIFE